MIEIQEDLSIPEDEVTFAFSRSGGPGGQNVNKVSTRATLYFDVRNSPSLSEERKTLIMERLAGRIDKEGVLRVVSQRYRTQGENREETVRRFAELLRGALEIKRARKKTRTPFSAHRERLEKKKKRSEVKRARGKVTGEE